jgi:hypothetical protein
VVIRWLERGDLQRGFVVKGACLLGIRVWCGGFLCGGGLAINVRGFGGHFYLGGFPVSGRDLSPSLSKL